MLFEILKFAGYICGMFFAALFMLGLSAAIIYALVHLFSSASALEFIGISVVALVLLLIFKISQ